MGKKRSAEYLLKDDGGFLIKNYDLTKPFASFFPGIAGLFGIPMWVFYVNRGQGIVSFGTDGKRKSILEFFPANQAWQMVCSRGFRTFLKIESAGKAQYYEPFQNHVQSMDDEIIRAMNITSAGLSITDTNNTLGLEITVEYFTVPNEPLACLARKLTVKNIGSEPKRVEVLDGLAQIVPNGLSDRFLKDLGRTMEAWMQVESVTQFKAQFYKLSVDPTDRPQVIHVKGGNFYYAFLEQDNKIFDCDFIVDPAIIFGTLTDFSHPACFFSGDVEYLMKNQMRCCKTPSAFSYTGSLELKPQGAVCLKSFVGHTETEKHLESFLKNAKKSEYLLSKERENIQIVDRIQNNIFTASEDNAYNLYARQTYLDNVLRGGLPYTLRTPAKNHTFHVYSRKHGDLERDYNNFLLEPTYFSQGNGNFRDVNQNRRDDVWFNPQVEDSNITTFFDLLQLDGFNPLIVFGARFMQKGKINAAAFRRLFENSKDADKVLKFIKNQFAPGNLFMFLEEQEIKLKVSQEKFFETVMSFCERQENAEHGEGFWVDHWTYNLDALESYLAIFPENLKKILVEQKRFVYFNNFVKVKPRDEKYVLFEGKARQYHAVSVEDHEESAHSAKKMSSLNWAVRTKFGKGDIYKTNLLSKIICLVTNKAASLDPFGCGIEMEANKPGWYDALNGLPGLFGSSVSEVMELKRLADFLSSALDRSGIKSDFKVALPVELYEFFLALERNLSDYFKDKSARRDFTCWEKISAVKEKYREKIHDGISGKEQAVTVEKVKSLLKLVSDRLELAIDKSRDKSSGLYHTYFINEIVDFEKIKAKKGYKLSKDGLICIRAKKFRQVPLPLFLEAQVHAFRVNPAPRHAKNIYIQTLKSALYDRKLKMFKVNASLEKMSLEIGRARVFTPGWLENESIWLHMDYKFILELLRCGLYEEFYTEFKNSLIAFQPPEQYGRSILENSSFLVSSAYPDQSLHGNGFVARLSGSTAEFLTMWLWMNAGRQPFLSDERGNLRLKFEPVLPEWMFIRKDRKFEYITNNSVEVIELPKNSYAFNFLGRTLVVYHNPKRRKTFGADAVTPKSMELTDKQGRKTALNSAVITGELCVKVRSGDIARIDIMLG